MKKSDRQKALQQLIRQKDISTQEELVAELIEVGFAVTQASISRDIEELGIAKVNGHYKMPPVAIGDPMLRSLEPAGSNLIVGRCPSGLASAVTVKIDAAAIPYIIGTVAGDDTIFIAVADETMQAAAVKAIWELFEI
ncbi:MAG: arginine repressor [Acidobacteria bacterium]|nr:arginine repressor [Acidobacteriota bacterium]